MVNNVIVISGGAGALCAPYAIELGKRKKSIALLDLNIAKARGTADKIIAAGGKALALSCDITDKASVESAHQEILEKFGKCTVLVNCAGVNLRGSFTENETYNEGDEKTKSAEGPVNFFTLDIAVMKKAMDINLFGTFICSQVFAPDMTGGGSIINFSSMTATEPTTKNIAYSASKAAVSNMTQWMAVHLARAGIRVNAVAPGFFITPVTEIQYLDGRGNPTERYNKVVRHTPAERMGRADDLTGALLFLSDLEVSGFITGTIIPVDGGFRAYSGI
jgi:NAD(P)-dependent dehydrogenase (short-subunit alcohol dehydrogenase family)